MSDLFIVECAEWYFQDNAKGRHFFTNATLAAKWMLAEWRGFDHKTHTMEERLKDPDVFIKEVWDRVAKAIIVGPNPRADYVYDGICVSVHKLNKDPE